MRKRTLVFAVLALLLLGLAAVPAQATDPPGTGTPGYWKNHPDAWPVDTICFLWDGTNDNKVCIGPEYTKVEAISIMKMPVKGDKTYTLFPATIAAILNYYAGNTVDCPVDSVGTIGDIIDAARGWLIAHPPGDGVEGSSVAWQEFGEWKYEWLDAYNNGELCAPSRDALE
jgi:hypothetical protein